MIGILLINNRKSYISIKQKYKYYKPYTDVELSNSFFKTQLEFIRESLVGVFDLCIFGYRLRIQVIS